MTQIDDIRLILNAIAADIPGFIQTGIPENVKSQNVRSLHHRDNQAAQQMLDLLEQLHESSQLLQGDEDPNEEPPSEFFRAGYFYLQWETTEFSRIPIAFYVCTGVPELGWWKFPSLSALPITHYGVGADPNEGLGLSVIPNLGDYYVQTDDGTASGEVLSVWFYTGVQAGDKWVKIVKGEGGDSGDTPTLQEVWDEDSNVETPDGSSIVIKDTAGARDNIVPFTIIGGDVESTFFKDDGNFVDSFCSKFGLWALGSFNPTSLNNNNVANHAYGYAVLYSLITGSRNTGIGSNALFSITSGHENVAVGSNAGSGFYSGGTKVQNGNTWLGTESGVEAQEVNSTTVIGFRAAFKFRNGNHNIMIGSGSASNFRDGSGNTIIGRVGFPANTDIDNNVILATGEAANLTGVVFRVFEDGTTVIPKQTKGLYDAESTGKAVVTKEILEAILSSLPGGQSLDPSDSIDIVSGEIQRMALTGDVTASKNSNALTIAANAVTFAKMQKITAARLLGNFGDATAEPSEIQLGDSFTYAAGKLEAWIRREDLGDDEYGFWLNQNGKPSNIGEGSVNLGYDGKAQGDYSSVLGGGGNSANGQYSIVAGGMDNVANSDFSVVLGGSTNFAWAQNSVVVSGYNNAASGSFSIILNGLQNEADAYCEVVGGLYATKAASSTAGSWVATDRLWTIGNGTADEARSDAFILLKNGLATLPSVSKGLIDAEPTGTAITTKEWVNEAISGQRKIFTFDKGDAEWTSDGSKSIQLSKAISVDDWANKIKATITWEDPFEGYKEFGHLANVEGGYLRCAVFIRGNTGNIDISLFLHDAQLGGKEPFTIPEGAKLILEY